MLADIRELKYVDLRTASDEALASAIKQGYTPAFQMFYDRYHLKLLVQLRFLSLDSYIAEDICQDAFVKLWENRQQIDPQRSLMAYTRKIAHNLFIDSSRKQQLQQAYCKEAANERQEVNDVSACLFHKELKNKLEQALQLLPKEKQNIYRLRREEQMSYKQIADLENTTPKAVERHVARINTFLKRYLAEYVDVAWFVFPGILFQL